VSCTRRRESRTSSPSSSKETNQENRQVHPDLAVFFSLPLYDLSVSSNLPAILWIILLAIGTHRATRLITRDKLPVIGIPREAFVLRWGVYEDAVGDERKISIGKKQTNVAMASLAYLWECDWCASMWTAGLLTYLTYRWPETMLWVLLLLTASTVTGLLAQAEAIIDKKLK
jgi:hypothetical protein